jgi:pyruvate/2-oxoglutarate dehydrogenase complex dihydrolipoamide acyltransferase (E2) component
MAQVLDGAVAVKDAAELAHQMYVFDGVDDFVEDAADAARFMEDAAALMEDVTALMEETFTDFTVHRRFQM